MSSQSDCVRVEFEYADGTVKHLVGKDAKVWMEEANGAFALSQMHDCRFTAFTWEVSQRVTNDAALAEIQRLRAVLARLSTLDMKHADERMEADAIIEKEIGQ